MLNVVNLVGRVGTDPEIRRFESGPTLCELSLAINWMSGDTPVWFKLKLWGRIAEVAAQYVRKGNQIGITGSLNCDYWNDRATGDQRQSPFIKVKQLTLLGKSNTSNSDDNEQNEQTDGIPEF